MSREDLRSEWLRAGTFPGMSGVEGLISRASDLAVYLSSEGIVEGVSVSADSPSLGCLDHWVGRPFTDFLATESKEKFLTRIAALNGDPELVPRPIELNHVDNATWEFPVKYTIHRTGDGALLLMGRDMQPIAEVQQRLVAEQLARERDQQKLRSEETFYRVVLEASQTPLVIVEKDTGRVRDLNSAAALMFGTSVETVSGSLFAQVFEGRRRGEFIEALQAAASAEEARAIEVIPRRNGRYLSLWPEYFRAAGSVYILCVVEPVSEGEASSPQAAHALAALFTATSDAIVMTDSSGVIRDVNEAFLILADAAQLRDVKGESLADFFMRGGVDLKLILDAASTQDRLARYQSQFRSMVGNRVIVDVSAARLRQKGGELGYGFIIRAATDVPNAESEAPSIVSDEAMKNMVDLVGTVSLKDLVSATSDVVEKMCIETAIKLTNNNRVAAAEMLGLSRQSLYVKLRKYGLLNSDGSD